MHKHPHHHDTPLLEEATYTNIGDGVIRVEMKGKRAIVYLPDWVIKVVVPDRAMPAEGRELYLARKDGAVLDITIGWDKHQIVNDKHGPHEETFNGVKAVHLIQKDGIQEWVALNYTPDVNDIVEEQIQPWVDRAEAAADRAEIYGKITAHSCADFFSRTDTPNGEWSTQDASGAWLVGAPGTGHFNHPITGKGVEVLPVGGRFSVQAFNIFPTGIDQTGRIMVADSVANAHGMSLFWPDCDWKLGAHYGMRGPIRAKASWVANWNAAEIRLKGTIMGESSPGFFLPGTFGYGQINTMTFHGVSPWNTGSMTVNLTTPADATSYNVGDWVWIEGGPRFTASVRFVSRFAGLNQITAKSGNTITLRYPLTKGESINTQIARVNDTTHFLTEGREMYGFRLVSDVSFGTLFRAGGMVNCKMHLPHFDGDSAVFVNAIFHSDIQIDEIIVDRHIAELALNSDNVTVHYNRATLRGNYGDKYPLRSFSECASRVHITINECNLPLLTEMTTSGSGIAPITITEASQCSLKIGVLNAPVFTGSMVDFFNYSRGVPGYNFPLADNVIEIREINAPFATGGVRFRNSGRGMSNNAVRKSRFNISNAAVSAISLEEYSASPEVSDCEFTGGAMYLGSQTTDERIMRNKFATEFSANDRRAALINRGMYQGNATPSLAAARAQDFNRSNLIVTAGTINNPAITVAYPPNSLIVADRVEFSISGTIVGDGTKNIRLLVGTTVIGVASTTETGPFILRGVLSPISDTFVSYSVESVGKFSISTAERPSVPNIAENGLTMVVQAWVVQDTEGVAASINIRDHQVKLRRPGYNW